MTSYSLPHPIQIYILNYLLYYVFACGSTLLHSFSEFETLIEKWCQCDIILTVIFYSNLHFKSCFILCLCFWLNFTIFILGAWNFDWKWCQCDILLKAVSFSNLHIKSCLMLCLCFWLNFTSFILGVWNYDWKMMSVWHLTHSQILFKLTF